MEGELTIALRLFEALKPAEQREFLRLAIDAGELPKLLRAAMLAMLDTVESAKVSIVQRVDIISWNR